MNYTVAFTGILSSGKSSVINSLCTKKILPSEISKTLAVHYNEECKDDVGNEFKCIDFPGIEVFELSDNSNINKIYEEITNANLIIWVSDINTSFTASHEINEYNKLKEYINKISNDTGKLYYIVIMLSKANKSDIDIENTIKKLEEQFSEDIIVFNSFGKIYFDENTTDLIKFDIEKIYIPYYNIYTQFDISKYYCNYTNKQNELFMSKFNETMLLYLDNKSDLSNLLKLWNNMTDENKKIFIDKLDINTDIVNINFFDFIASIINLDKSVNDYLNIILILLYNFAHVLNNKYDCVDIINKLNQNEKIINGDNVLVHIYDLFESNIKKLYNLKYNSIVFKFHEKILLDPEFITINSAAYSILCRLYNLYTRDALNFNIIFTKLITDEKTTSKTFNIFYTRIIQTIKSDYILVIDINNNIADNIKIFFDYIISLNTDDYILLNKLQIIKCLYEKSPITCNFKEILKTHIRVNMSRLYANKKFVSITNAIWKKIYSNILLPYNSCNYDYFIPFSPIELLY